MEMELPRSYFSCKLCNYQTNHRRYLITHKKKMHTANLNKKYSCTICEASFERVALYQNHLKYKLCRKKVQVVQTNGEDQSQSGASSGDLMLEGDRPTYPNKQPEVIFRNSCNRKTSELAGNFESEEGLNLPTVGFYERMSSQMETAKIRSPYYNSPDQIVDLEDEGNDSDFELNIPARPVSRMALKLTNSQEPHCSVIQSEPILVWNTLVVPIIKVQRLKTDEDAKLIAKWLLKNDFKQDKIVKRDDSTNIIISNSQSIIIENNYCDNIVTDEDSTVANNPGSAIHENDEQIELNYKRFKCGQCGKRYCLKRTWAAHVKYFHQNPFSFNCTLCHRVFNTRALLNRHITQIHNSNRKIKCLSCNDSFHHLLEFRLHKPLCLEAQQLKSNSLGSTGNSEGTLTTEISKPVTNDDLEPSTCVEIESAAFPVVYKKRRRKRKRLLFASLKNHLVVNGPKPQTSPKSLLLTGENEISTTTEVASVAATEGAETLEDEAGTRCPECGAKCVSAEAVAAHLKRHKIKI